jgi:oligopeptide transport system permease protein
MTALLLRRLLQAVPVLLAVTALTFALVRLAPGGPFDAERAAPPEVMRSLAARYHLDDPWHRQLLDYVGHAVRGDLGPSFRYPGRSVGEIIAAAFPVTLELAACAFLIALALGIAAGTLAAARANSRIDRMCMLAASAGISLPTFVLGPLLILVFAVRLEWVPVSGWGYLPGDKVLPSLTLGLACAAQVARLARAGMVEVLHADFIRTARAKGLGAFAIMARHALRGGLAPVVAFLGPALAALLSGSFVVETLFQVPGLGRYYVQAAFNRDYTLILGMTVFFATLVVLCNMLADLVALWLDPRLRRPPAAH